MPIKTSTNQKENYKLGKDICNRSRFISPIYQRERETEEEEETNILIKKWRKILIVCRERTDVSLNMVNLELKRNQIKTSLRNRSPSISLTKD